jgi:FMN phosphatase YigB (HAD superfamily)
MKSLKEHIDVLDEAAKKSSLHVFDIDDTLFHTHAKIHVKDPMGKTVAKLSNSEFNDHKLDRGHSYDFHEFRSADKFHKTSKPIQPMLQKIKAIHNHVINVPHSRVIMNTARADFDNKEKFLDTFRHHGVPVDHQHKPIHVHRAGNEPGTDLPAVKKNAVLRRYLDKHPYGSVHMYDDSKTNLHHFLKLKHEYPTTNFHAWHAQPNGSLKKYHGEEK